MEYYTLTNSTVLESEADSSISNTAPQYSNIQTIDITNSTITTNAYINNITEFLLNFNNCHQVVGEPSQCAYTQLWLYGTGIDVQRCIEISDKVCSKMPEVQAPVINIHYRKTRDIWSPTNTMNSNLCSLMVTRQEPYIYILLQNKSINSVNNVRFQNRRCCTNFPRHHHTDANKLGTYQRSKEKRGNYKNRIIFD